MKMKKQKTTTITTREELERVMGEFAQATIARGQLAFAMEARLNEIRHDYESRLAEFDEAIEAFLADLEAWAVMHPADFATRRSIDLVHGVIGFRTGQPALKTIKGVKWDHVLDMLKLANHLQYVRTEESVDKEAILAEREQIGEKNLEKFGMRVEQAERFYAEPKLEQV